jgi:hypothetical protein
MRKPRLSVTRLAGLMLVLVSALPSEGVAAQTQAVDIRLVPEFTTIPSGGSVDLTIDVVPNG